jgi:hypothetical protein
MEPGAVYWKEDRSLVNHSIIINIGDHLPKLVDFLLILFHPTQCVGSALIGCGGLLLSGADRRCILVNVLPSLLELRALLADLLGDLIQFVLEGINVFANVVFRGTARQESGSTQQY